MPSPDKGGADTTISTPLDPTPDQLADYELIGDITIWIHKVNSTYETAPVNLTYNRAQIDGYAVSKQADEALSRYLGKPVRLVRKGPTLRPSGPHDPAGPLEYAREEASVNMQDLYVVVFMYIRPFCDIDYNLATLF